jgi:phosphoserine phosphatase
MNVIGADGIAGAVMVSDSDADVPVITAVGFTVSGGFNTLNQNGITYHFTAWS